MTIVLFCLMMSYACVDCFENNNNNYDTQATAVIMIDLCAHVQYGSQLTWQIRACSGRATRVGVDTYTSVLHHARAARVYTYTYYTMYTHAHTIVRPRARGPAFTNCFFTRAHSTSSIKWTTATLAISVSRIQRIKIIILQDQELSTILRKPATMTARQAILQDSTAEFPPGAVRRRRVR